MGLKAVLPPSTSWGFQFHSTAESTSNNTSSSLESSSLKTAAAGDNNTSENISNNNTPNTLAFSNLFVSKPTKRKLPFAEDRDDFEDDESNYSSFRNTDLTDRKSPNKFASLNGHNNTLSIEPSSTKRQSSHSASLHTSPLYKYHNSSSKQFNGTIANNSISPSRRGNISRHHTNRIHKRARFERINSRPLPINRLVETLDKKALETLITSLVQQNPHLNNQINQIAPKITISVAISALEGKFQAIFDNLPYKVDPRGDYAYLRVRPYIEEFLHSMHDFICHFLPPHEQQITNSLAFLDSVTMMLHKLPKWNNDAHNSSRRAAYDLICNAWMVTLQEACVVSNNNNNEEHNNNHHTGVTLSLAFGGWQKKLEQHDELSVDHLLIPAVNFIRQELDWINNNNNRLHFNDNDNNYQNNNNNNNNSNNNNNDNNNNSFSSNLFSSSPFNSNNNNSNNNNENSQFFGVPSMMGVSASWK